MKPLKRVPTTKLNEEELTKQLVKTLIILVSLVILLILSFTVFAPAFGSIFKIFSRGNLGNALVIKPSKPLLSQLPNATKETKIKVNGYAQEGMTIKLYVNGPEKGSTVVGGDGLFVFEEIELIKGRNTVFAKAIDSKGIESDTTDTYIVVVDNEEPKIELDSPKDGDTVRNLDKRITVKGKVNEKVNLTVNDQVAIVKADMTFEHVIGVEEGDVEIKIKAVDEAGNEKEETLKVKYQRRSS